MAGDRKKFQKAISQANSAAWDMEWNNAAEFYRMALDEFPESPVALTSLGLALYEQRKYDEALVYYKKAALLNPEDPMPYEKVADIYGRQGRLREAVQSSIHAAELNLKMHDAEKAISCYQQATSLDPENLHAHIRLGLIFERMKKSDKAIHEYLDAASLLQRTGKIVQAAKKIEHCLVIDPENESAINAKKTMVNREMLPSPKPSKNVSATVRMAEVMKPKKDPVTQQLITAEDHRPVEYFRQQSLIYLASLLFEPPSALTMKSGRSSTMSEEKKNDISIMLNKSVNALTHNQQKEALTALKSLVKDGVYENAIFYNLGIMLADQQPKQAIGYLEHCVRKEDYALGAYLILGKIFLTRGGLNNLQRAAAFYIRALGIADMFTVDSSKHNALRESYVSVLDEPQQIQTEDGLVTICDTIESQINRKDWINYLSKIRTQLPDTDPKHPAPLSDLLLKTSNGQVLEIIANIQTLVSEEKFNSAMEEAFYAIKFAPNYLPLHIEIAQLLSMKGDLHGAVRKYLLVSQLYLLRGELNQGTSILEEVLRLSPMDHAVRVRLIELLIDQERIPEAIEQYMKLAANYEVNANFDQMRKVYFDALRLASQCENSREWSLRILYLIADIDMTRMDWHRAQRVYEQICTIAPEDDNARQELIGVYFRLGQDQLAAQEVDQYLSLKRETKKLSEGISFIKSLIETWPKKYTLRRELAETFAKTNHIEEALDQLNTIASAYLDEGKTEKTIEILQRMMALDPEHGGEYQLVVDRVRRHQSM
ncbi:MAG: tetratricopeptide repeat protein [Anaerolineaceae bacterium]|nr:tetratricopeptide repeat protein [Anaerolineaceae bacterium]